MKTEAELAMERSNQTAAFMKRIAELEKQLAEAKRDTVRLDWLDKIEAIGTVAWKAVYPDECGFAWVLAHTHRGKDLREAIDAAMSAGTQQI